jgi:hypothetical protein
MPLQVLQIVQCDRSTSRSLNILLKLMLEEVMILEIQQGCLGVLQRQQLTRLCLVEVLPDVLVQL